MNRGNWVKHMPQRVGYHEMLVGKKCMCGVGQVVGSIVYIYSV